MIVEPPLWDFVTVIEDSRRWSGIDLRADDIIISTPPKSGTTWTQGMLLALTWPAGDEPDMLSAISLWPDNRMRPVEHLNEVLAAQTHRRFIKTHSPRNAVPHGSTNQYVTVYRDPTDAFVSWGNHRATMRPQIIEHLNGVAAEADGLDPLPLQFDGDYDVLFDEWSRFCSPAIHLADWWPHRHDPNVRMSHYADLWADLDGEMRALAGFLGIEVPDGLWEPVVERCRLDAMREQVERAGGMDRGFEGGAASFYYRGGTGRGADLLTAEQIDRVRTHCESLLPPDAVAWLETGGPLP